MLPTSSWIEAMRLRTLPVSLAGVFCGCAYAIAAGCFSWLPALICLIFALLCQIASNFANEYFDFKEGRDKAGREGPRRGVTEGDISPKAMKAAIIATLALAALLGLSLTLFAGLWLIIPGVLIFIGAMAYSTGPFPLSTHCLGELAVIAFFGVVPVNLTFYVQALSFSWPVFMGSLSLGLMGANVLIVNNTRDIPDDRAVGKHTLATVFGVRAMCVLYAVNALSAAALTLSFWLGTYLLWLAVPALFAILSMVVAVRLGHLHGAALTPLLGITSVMMSAFALCMVLKAFALTAL